MSNILFVNFILTFLIVASKNLLIINDMECNSVKSNSSYDDNGLSVVCSKIIKEFNSFNSDRLYELTNKIIIPWKPALRLKRYE